MTSPQTVLIVDDEADVRLVYKRYLTVAGYRVVECENGATAVLQVPRLGPDLIILDVDMPGLNGWKTLAALREQSCRQPVLMVTFLSDPTHRVAGLEGGADDYLGKPCDLAEMLARVRALLRRPPLPLTSDRVLRRGNVTVDFARRQTTRAGRPLSLTRKEYAVLELLARHAGRPVTREIILREVWGLPPSANSHTIDTHLWRLRKKLDDRMAESPWIRCLPGIGYALEGGDGELPKRDSGFSD